MSLFDFQGPQAQQDALPTAPSRMEDDGGGYGGRGGGRYGDRGGRYGDRGGGGGGNPWERRAQEEPASQSESSGNWRSVRGGGGRSGGGGFGGSRFGGEGGFGGSRGGGGLHELSSRNRFDADDSSSRWGGGSQDSRFGGRSQDSRFGGGRTQDPRMGGSQDTRPAHLRRFGKAAASANVSAKPAALTRDQEQTKQRSNKWDEEQKAIRLAEEAAKKAEADAKKAARKGTYADGLQAVAVVSYAHAKSPLEVAVNDLSELSADALTESFQRLDLKKTELPDVVLVLANSLVDKKFSVTQFIDSLKADCKDEAERRQLLCSVMKSLHHKSTRTLRKLLADADINVILEMINNTGLSEEDFTKHLVDEGLFFLKPIPDISAEVSAALETGASPDDLLALINSKIDASQSPANLAPIITAHVLSIVFADKKETNLEPIATFAPVLARCESDVESEMAVLFAAQRVWYKAGGVRKFICPLFKKFYETEVVSFDGLARWRDDRDKKNSRGKPQALLGTNSWITEITPIVIEEDDEDEELDEEEEVDSYLKNPNAEFYK